MRIKSTSLTVREFDIKPRSVPVKGFDLAFLSSTPSDRLDALHVHFDGSGWLLGLTEYGYLLTQRGQFRRFKTLEAVCSALCRLNVSRFTVSLTGVSADRSSLVQWRPSKEAQKS